MPGISTWHTGKCGITDVHIFSIYALHINIYTYKYLCTFMQTYEDAYVITYDTYIPLLQTDIHKLMHTHACMGSFVLCFFRWVFFLPIHVMSVQASVPMQV